MTLKGKGLLTRARKLRRQDEIVFVTIIGDPEARRLGLPMASNREALIGNDYYEAAPDESTKAFHARLKKTLQVRVAREKDAGKSAGGRVRIIVIGHPDNAKSLQEAPPYER